MSMRWSPAKEKVFAFESDIAVCAGAGSGKTAALVELYLRLLGGRTALGEVGVADIAAITFTDKAATEMEERIRKGIEERIRTEPHLPWESHLRQLPEAAISTFHSFCARLLREFPAEADVDPVFTMLDETAADDEMQRAVEDLLAEEMGADAGDLADLLRLFPFASTGRGKGVGDHLAEAHARWTGSGKSFSFLSEKAAEWERAARSEFERALAALNGLCPEVERIVALPEKKFHTALRPLPSLVCRPTSCDDPATGKRLQEVAACVAGNWGKEKPVRDALAREVERLRLAWAQVQGGRPFRAYVRLLERLEELYRMRKERLGALDFEDLQLSAVRLLRRNPAIRQELRKRLRVVMVDEFQDTNPLQEELVGLLCGDGQRLFIVGDPKQSIYLFRGADVEVFLRARDRITAGGGELLFFRESFRSRPGIIRFVNGLFTLIMQGGGGNYDIPYGEGDALEAQRTEDTDRACVELLHPEEDLPPGVRGEAAAVASYIRSLAAGDAGVSVLAEGFSRTPRYGDMAILLRRFSNLKVFEGELRRLGIPFHVVKGRGFYQCREVADMLCLLRYLEQSGDIVALAGLLRSPLCGVSDETLFLLSLAQGGIAAWETEPRHPLIASADLERLQRLDSLLRRLRPLRDRLTVAEILEDAITATGFSSTLLGTFQGEQKVANLRKLIEFARASAASGDNGLRSFVSRLRRLVESEPSEAEAVVAGEGGNAVRLMTVHQSKGLEFPVVFVPELGAATPGDTSPFVLDTEMGGGMRLPVHGKGSEPSLAYSQIRGVRRARELAETKRLFYVAVTRARDHLVLSGEGRGDWRRWIEEFIDGGADCISTVRTAAAVVSAATAERDVQAGLDAQVLKRVLAPLPPPLSVDLSVTGLAELAVCPRKFYYKEILGLDEGLFAELLQKTPRWKGKRQELSAVEKGTLAHAVLEEADFAALPEEQLRGAREVLRRRGLSGSAEAEAVMQETLGFVRSPLGRVLGASTLRRECPFIILLKGEGEYRIRGAMDLVAEREGEVAVYDYKYVRGEMPEGYRFQLMIYMLALHRAFPSCTVRGWLVPLRGGDPEMVEPGDFAALERRLVGMIDGIRGGRREDDFPPKADCDGHCPFRQRCPGMPVGDGKNG